MDDAGRMRRRNSLVVLCALGVLAVMACLVVFSPTLIRVFTGYIGYGDVIARVEQIKSLDAPGVPKTVTVRFDTNLAGALNWTLRAEKRSVTVHIGRPETVYFQVVNRSGGDGVVHTAFNVTPAWAAPYFFKAKASFQSDERLGAGQSARVPLVFYVDPRIRDDPLASDVSQITLSYTFFERPNLTPSARGAIENLAEEAAAFDRRLRDTGSAVFVNDATD